MVAVVVLLLAGLLTVGSSDPAAAATEQTGLDGLARFHFGIDELPSSGTLTVNSQLRATDSAAYAARARISADGTVELSITRERDGDVVTVSERKLSPVKLVPGETLVVRLEVEGTSSVTLDAGMRHGSTWTGVSATDASGERLVEPGAARQAVTVAAGTPVPALVRDPDIEFAAGAASPNASNTGVPEGTQLTRHEGNLVADVDGMVIDGLEVHGIVDIRADNVVIKTSRIVGGDSPNFALVHNVNADPGNSFTVIDSEIAANTESTKWNGIYGSNFTATRVNVHHVTDPIRVSGDNVTVRDSWLHDTTYKAQDSERRDGGPTHDDNIQIQGGGNIVIEGNRMESTHNAAIMIAQEASRPPIGTISIKGNYLNDGACTIKISETPTDIHPVIEDNVFGPDRVHDGCTVLALRRNAPTMSGNTMAADGSDADGTLRLF
ncbi:MAG: right-handed parallel beta-helix repeat-containing protein [Acidimicrobiales bacterium]